MKFSNAEELTSHLAEMLASHIATILKDEIPLKFYPNVTAVSFIAKYAVDNDIDSDLVKGQLGTIDMKTEAVMRDKGILSKYYDYRYKQNKPVISAVDGGSDNGFDKYGYWRGGISTAPEFTCEYCGTHHDYQITKVFLGKRICPVCDRNAVDIEEELAKDELRKAIKARNRAKNKNKT